MGLKPRILYSQRSLSDPTNPYSELLFASLSDKVTPLAFTWKNALFGKYDLLHLQWPEYVLREKHLHLRFLNFCLAYAWIARLHLWRVPIVETVHNLKPHDHESVLERSPLKRLRNMVGCCIYLNHSTENDPSKGPVILHGHYRSVIAALNSESSASTSSYFVFFGLIRPYKGMEKLIAAFQDYVGPVERLIVAGHPVSEEYAERLRTLAASDSRINFDFRHIPERELVGLVSEAEGVILPYEYMYNSGALIYSLSAATPVLAPASPANSAIQLEVGDNWVITFDGDLHAEHLRKLSAARRTLRFLEPDLDNRDWNLVGTQHLLVYQGLLHGTRSS